MVQITSSRKIPGSPISTEYMNKKLGFIAMLLSATGMGFVGTFSRLSTPIDPLTGSRYVIGDFLAFGRMTTGAIGMVVILLALKKLPALRTTRISFSVIAGGLSIGTSLALYVSSTLMTTIANAVFLIYTGPLFSAILAWIFLKERITPKKMGFLALVFSGMVLTIGIINYSTGAGFTVGFDVGSVSDLPNKTMGDLFGLASGLFYGLALFFYRYRGDIASEVRAFWNFVFGAVGALIVMFFRIRTLDPTNPFDVMTSTNWLWAAVLFLVCGFMAIGMLVVAGKHLLAIELSTVSYWEVVVGVFLGIVVYSESLTLIGLIGGVLIVVGGMGPMFFRDKKSVGATQVDAMPEANESTKEPRVEA